MTFKKRLREQILYGNERRPPVSGVRLNVPGKSSLREFDLKLSDFLLYVFTLFLILGSLLIFGSIYRSEPEIMLMILAIAGIAAPAPALFANRSLKDLRKWHLGWYCEAVIGQELERCRSYGYSVFHDIEYESGGKRFNVDHLLIGPAGVIVIETKGRTKLKKGITEAEISNGRLVFSGRTSERHPVSQINALASTVEKDLKKVMRASGLSAPALPITKIMAVPGWFVKNGKAGNDILLTMQKTARKTIAGLPENPQFSKIANDLARAYEEGLDDEAPRKV